MVSTSNYFEDQLLKESTSKGWTINQAPAAAIEKMLSAITIFTISIIHLEGRYKLSQNKSAQVREEIARKLSARGQDKLGRLMSEI